MIKLKIKYGNSQTDLRFPCTEKEMNAALERIHAEDVTPLELYVSEVVFPEELGYLQDRFVNLDEVNYLGKRMDSFFGDEEYQFYEAMKLEGFDTLPDLINLSFNLTRYPLIQDMTACTDRHSDIKSSTPKGRVFCFCTWVTIPVRLRTICAAQ